MSEPEFTPDQLSAVKVGGRPLDTCVVAGPGSGKTTVLVEYFRRLVEAGADPLRILAITFTEKAAANMRKKLAGAFREDSAIRARLERAWVSTVHGFCARLLKENAVFAGVDPEFGVADERESWRMQQESIAAAFDALLADHPAALGALVRGLASPDFEEALLSAYDAMRGAGTRVEDLARFPLPPGTGMAEVAAARDALKADPAAGWTVAQRLHLRSVLDGAAQVLAAWRTGPAEALGAVEVFYANLRKCRSGTSAYELVEQLRERVREAKYSLIGELYAKERELLLDVLRRFDHIYRERKRQAGLLDFADLEEFAVRLLEEHPATQFDHILMDEFQDTNPQQARLLKLVRPPGRFYAVGDINQSIFGFRHAEPQGFLDYRNSAVAGGRVVELVANFRSRPEILRGIETIVDGAPGIEPRRLVAGAKFADTPVVPMEVIAAAQEDIETRWVARRILESPFQFKDIAVLVRNTEVIPAFTAAFDEAGIPYLVNRGRGFYETREVLDLAHLLRVIANPRDEVSLAAVLRSPLVGVSDEALLRLRIAGENIGASLKALTPVAAAEFRAADAARLSRFRDHLREWRTRREYDAFDRLLVAAIDDCGYRPESGPRGAANIDKFLAQARDAAARLSLDEFVGELAWVRDSNPREPDAPPEDSADAVKVMTVHAAKGLEFPVVFVAALHKGIESNPPVVAFSPRVGLGARWRNPARREEKDDLFQHEIRKQRQRREAEESSRLLYVAMTRAGEHLVLSFSGAGRKLPNWAGMVAGRLNLNLETCRDEVLTRIAPGGREWQFRLIVTDQVGQASWPAHSKSVPPPPDEVEFLPPPAITGQQNTNATVTALAQFAICPRQYYLGRHLGFEGRARQPVETTGTFTLPAGEFGTQVHSLLAGAAVPDAGPDAVRLAEVFRQSRLGRRLVRAGRIEREFDFLMAVEDLVIRGQVDLWFEEGGELVIVDYKTDAVNAAEAHQRAPDYALQLRLYAMAVERAAGRAPDRAWLHFLRPDTAVEVDLTPSLLDSPEAIVRDFEEAQSKLEFPLNEGEHCRRCPFFRDLCPSEYGPKATAASGHGSVAPPGEAPVAE